jgi:hypothetical protein
MMYQYLSGLVDDDLIVSMTKQYGAGILVYGQLTAMGQGALEYRMTVYATDVEKASSSQRAYTVRPDNRLASLLNVSPDEEVERAVAAMARAVSQKTVIAVGKISYADTRLPAFRHGSRTALSQGRRNSRTSPRWQARAKAPILR